MWGGKKWNNAKENTSKEAQEKSARAVTYRQTDRDTDRQTDKLNEQYCCVLSVIIPRSIATPNNHNPPAETNWTADTELC